MAKAGSTEKVVREIRRHTRRRFSAEEKIRIERWTPIFGQVVKVESRSDRRNLECHARDGATRLS